MEAHCAARTRHRSNMTYLRTSLLLSLQALLVCVVALSSAAAQTPEEAEALSARGRDAFLSGDFEGAADLFERAYAADPHPVLLYNAGRALEAGGDPAAALAAYRRVAEEAEDEGVRAAAQGRAGNMEDLLRSEGYNPDTVTSESYRREVAYEIVTEPAGATAYLNGLRVGTTPVHASAREGLYELYLSADGYLPSTTTLEVSRDNTNTSTIALEARTSLDEYVAADPGQLTVIGPAQGMSLFIDGDLQNETTPIRGRPLPAGEYHISITHPEYHEYRTRVTIRAGVETRIVADMDRVVVDGSGLTNRQRIGTYTMIGGGAVLAAGAAFGVAALANSGSYNTDVNATDRASKRDAAQRNSTIADILIISGAIVTGAGATLRFLKPRHRDQADARQRPDDFLLLRAAPMPLRGGFGASVTAEW